MPTFPLPFRPAPSYKEGPRRFGAERGGKRLHAGCDLYAPAGTPVVSCQAGMVRRVTPFYRGTWAVEVFNFDGTINRYCELDASSVKHMKTGVVTAEGALIGRLGRMGGIAETMLHFERYSGGTGPLTVLDHGPYWRRDDLVDPTPYLDSCAVTDTKA